MRLGRVTSSSPLAVRLNGDTLAAPAQSPRWLTVGREVLVDTAEGRRLVVWPNDAAPGLVYGTAAAAGRNTIQVGSLNQYLDSGWYDGAGMTGAPSSEWFLVHVVAHSNNAQWVRQVAYSMTGEQGTQRTYSRRCNGSDPNVAGHWTPWRAYDLDGDVPRASIYSNTTQAGADFMYQFTLGHYQETYPAGNTGWWDSTLPGRLYVPGQAGAGMYACAFQAAVGIPADGTAVFFLAAYTPGGIHLGYPGIANVTAGNNGPTADSGLSFVNLIGVPYPMQAGGFFQVICHFPPAGGNVNGGYHINPNLRCWKVSK